MIGRSKNERNGYPTTLMLLPPTNGGLLAVANVGFAETQRFLLLDALTVRSHAALRASRSRADAVTSTPRFSTAPILNVWLPPPTDAENVREFNASRVRLRYIVTSRCTRSLVSSERSNPPSTSFARSGRRSGLPNEVSIMACATLPSTKPSNLEKLFCTAICLASRPDWPTAARKRRLETRDVFGKKGSSDASHDTLSFGKSGGRDLLTLRPNALARSWRTAPVM